MPKDVIIACDFENATKTLEFLDLFKDEKPYVKIGMELFYSEGKDIIKEIKRRGHKIFLDLKLHDIPNTVQKMSSALKGLTSENGKRPILIAVTQLTSTSEEVMQKDLLIDKNMESVIEHYALNSKNSGLDGVVCSPLESKLIHETCGKNFITVTPGIRFSDENKGDQVRVTTPKMARELGSDYIVVGRPITQAENPVKAYKKCIKEFLG